ncbi:MULTISPECIES: PTS galactosamine/N-acetylgalactosamine transporter subunit IIA [Vibrio]|uniref:PTS sugar transporter subunit IIA n=1 Tax=Vibrio navarrensis TaxID=29495 RepID=A0AAJ4IH70_9VIBR|nr:MULTISPECIES: PTS galactosamine/N-acetylgalactosamine transporter subunit IIA [Vibrio]KJR38605.1 PTS mannose transporter subunit IIA [Vibrio sp. S234-5]MBE3662880.1 PTS mannose transporter subunit IIA [Vibrio navarrensis]MBE3671420.1 PTS mannose transporter subunit IIA [Vibrio navarrensis]MBE4594715.1 PTS mannose transporter subunit IIA [Vibrio navarrensis]QPL56597.1 PTS sugar transporter subunit IIA [Vibrio navarrensis]
MIGIVVSGHINFATGMQSAFHAIAGEQDQFEFVDFLESMSTDDLEDELRKAAKAVNTGDGVLFLCDVLGGSPCNRAMNIMLDTPNIEIVAGVNLAMIANSAFERDGSNLDDLVETLLEIGGSTMQSMRQALAKISAAAADDDNGL